MATLGLEVYNKFKNHLQSKNFKFDAHDDDLVIFLTVHGEDLPQPTLIKVYDDRNVVQIVSPIPVKMPEDKIIDGAAAVTAANYGMLNGCFEMNMSNGEIRFRIAHNFEETGISEKTVQYLLALTFLITDKFNDRFFMLAKGVLSLEQFIQKAGE